MRKQLLVVTVCGMLVSLSACGHKKNKAASVAAVVASDSLVTKCVEFKKSAPNAAKLQEINKDVQDRQKEINKIVSAQKSTIVKELKNEIKKESLKKSLNVAVWEKIAKLNFKKKESLKAILIYNRVLNQKCVKDLNSGYPY